MTHTPPNKNYRQNPTPTADMDLGPIILEAASRYD